MSKSTAAKKAPRATLRSFLSEGKSAKSFGPYSKAHTAHVRASQIRQMAREVSRDTFWSVTVNAEDATVRIAPAKAPRASKKATPVEAAGE